MNQPTDSPSHVSLDRLSTATADFLQLVVDTIPALVVSALPDGSVDFINQGWRDYTGLSLESLFGRGWNMVIHPDDLTAFVTEWDEARAAGRPFQNQVRVRRADGEYRWFLIRKAPLRDKSGKIIKWLGTGSDIEDLKQAEGRIRRNEAELQQIIDAIPAHVLAFQPDGLGLFANRQAVEYTGVSLQNLYIDDWITRILHSADAERVRSILANMLSRKEPFAIEARIRAKTGEYRWFLIRVSPLKDEDGGVVRWYGTRTDIEDLKRAEEALRRSEDSLRDSEQSLRLVVDGIAGLVAIMTSEGELQFVNNQVPEYFGKTLEELKGWTTSDAVHPDDFPRVVAAWMHSVETGDLYDVDHRLRRADGAYRWFHARGLSLRDAEGRIARWYVLLTDIDDRKRAEEALKQSEFYLSEGQRLAHMGSWAFNPSGFFSHWSTELFQIYGLDAAKGAPTLEEYLGCVHPEDREFMRSLIKQMMADSLGCDFIKRIVRPDGEVRYVHCVGAPVVENDRLERIVGSAMDVTEHEVLTQELRRRQAYLEEAQRLSHTGSFGWKPDSGEIVWSDETYRIFEYDRGTKPTIDLLVQRVHPEDRLEFLKVTEDASAGATQFEHAYRWLLPDGSVKHVHALAHALQDASGNREFVGAATDITERKIAEEKIREQEMELRQMLDLAPQYVAVFGPDGERVYANLVARDQVGLSLEEWRQTPQGFFRPGRFIHPDDRERAARGYSDSIRSGGSAYELELRIPGADGGYRWFLVRFNPVRNEHGQIVRWYVAGTDIDERKRAEEKLQLENAALREEIDQNSMFEEIVGTSPALRTVLSRISKVAPTDSTVLITGETGTGKELVARAIHKRSQRSGRAFISVNCAAIPRDLIASELFGHEKGAFTGALQRHLGRFELAEGGTIFLDEIGELPSETQIALLRVLQEKEFERVGGRQTIRANVRVIAATNRDLQAAVASGTFRSDLYYRLNVFPIAVPPLRERKEDIPMLVEYFVDRYASKMGKKIRASDRTTLDRLIAYPWPGNIRELQNVIERSIILCETESFAVDESWLSTETVSSPGVKLPLVEKMHSEEKEMIETALAQCKGRVSGPSGAAAKLGIPPSTLESKIRSLKIEKRSFF